MKLPCAHCHAGARTKERAGFPTAAICGECHKNAKFVAPRRIYTLPDFVFFSHGRHAAAGLKCDACHGDVAAADVVTKQAAMNMSWCVNCHKSSHAAVTCTACHELSQ
jgi:hypothetical protein